MKKLITSIFILFLILPIAMAQTMQQGMKYQAVARDLSGELMANQQIGLRIKLHNHAKTTSVNYTEVHNTVTNQFGLFSLVIGDGKVENGKFTEIPWSTEDIWMTIEIKGNKNSDFTRISSTKLLAVPYSYYALEAGELSEEKNNTVGKSEDKPPKPSKSGHWDIEGNIEAEKKSNEPPLLGNADYAPIVFITDGIERLRITEDGEIVTGDGKFTIGGNLEVQGDQTKINKDLYVGRDVVLNFDEGFEPRGETVNHGKFTSKGQVTINTDLDGGQSSYDAYPLRVEGSNQGIAIKVNAGTPNNSNNFITFFDNSGKAVGRIEGETKDEAKSSPEYEYNDAYFTREIVKAGVAIGESFIPNALGISWSSVAMAIGEEALAILNRTKYRAFAVADNPGVTYQSGSADYAEWLERINPNEKISAGDIVGVTNGKISKYTVNAQKYMVISTKPAMLGNMPMKGKEVNYEKVAFMGQIPVKVQGIVFVGDYILPSGKNDGIGIAVSPEDLSAKQYSEIVGVAWSSSIANSGISTINMAIGLNTNDVARLAIQQEMKIADMEQKFTSLEARLKVIQKGVDSNHTEVVADVTPPKKKMSRYEMALKYMPSELSNEVIDDAMTYLEDLYETQQINTKDRSGLEKLFRDATFKAEIIQKVKQNYRLTYQKYLEKVKMTTNK